MFGGEYKTQIHLASITVASDFSNFTLNLKLYSLGILILEIFIQKPPFVHFNEDSDDLNLRQAIRSTMELQNFDHAAIFPDYRHVGTIFASSQEIAYSCILRNPFLRPTASLVAQQIFDEFISMAATPASANMSTENLADGKIASPNSAFNDLAHRIISASRPKSAEESTILQSVANTSIATSISVAIPDTEFSSLLDAANLGAPALSYLVGIAYLKGLSALGMEQHDTSQPSEGSLPIIAMESGETADNTHFKMLCLAWLISVETNSPFCKIGNSIFGSIAPARSPVSGKRIVKGS